MTPTATLPDNEQFAQGILCLDSPISQPPPFMDPMIALSHQIMHDSPPDKPFTLKIASVVWCEAGAIDPQSGFAAEVFIPNNKDFQREFYSVPDAEKKARELTALPDASIRDVVVAMLRLWVQETVLKSASPAHNDNPPSPARLEKISEYAAVLRTMFHSTQNLHIYASKSVDGRIQIIGAHACRDHQPDTHAMH